MRSPGSPRRCLSALQQGATHSETGRLGARYKGGESRQGEGDGCGAAGEKERKGGGSRLTSQHTSVLVFTVLTHGRNRRPFCQGEVSLGGRQRAQQGVQHWPVGSDNPRAGCRHDYRAPVIPWSKTEAKSAAKCGLLWGVIPRWGQGGKPRRLKTGLF